MSDVPIRISRRGAVLEVVIDRPKANAIDARTSRMLGEVFSAFRDDPAFRVAVITGAGRQFFSAGWDVNHGANGEGADTDFGQGGFGGLQEMPGLNKPVVAAVNGLAVGGGFELALAADIIVASQEARFSLPEIRTGTIPDAATVRLPRRIPHHVAMEMLLTGRWMDAEEALRWGLVNEIAPAGDVLDRAREIARMLSEGPPLAQAAIKEAVRETEDLAFQDALNRITRRRLPAVSALYSSADHKEGADAFQKGRKPRWTGK